MSWKFCRPTLCPACPALSSRLQAPVQTWAVVLEQRPSVASVHLLLGAQPQDAAQPLWGSVGRVLQSLLHVAVHRALLRGENTRASHVCEMFDDGGDDDDGNMLPVLLRWEGATIVGSRATWRRSCSVWAQCATSATCSVCCSTALYTLRRAKAAAAAAAMVRKHTRGVAFTLVHVAHGRFCFQRQCLYLPWLCSSTN